MPVDAGSMHYVIGPVVTVVVLVLLVLFARWAFGGGGDGGLGRGGGAAAAGNDGLLTRVATLSRRESALALRAVLSDAGIRSTVRFPGAHRAEVLVFPEDAARARALAASFGG
ncbi:hypothetical protein ABC795_13440 [Blastococcus sp. HT6-30]|uniref:hypothetical protein n=1 Tax=Blastococcus sp. HT6-30 TaxID=3144843 RepID=UPI003219752F